MPRLYEYQKCPECGNVWTPHMIRKGKGCPACDAPMGATKEGEKK